MLIEIVADMVCPWCYVGKRRLEQALAARSDYNVQLRWRPFLLNPEQESGKVDRIRFLTRLFGSESRVRQFHEAVDDAGRTVGIPFALDRLEFTPSSVPAHRLVKWIQDRGGCATDVVESLYHAHFVDGLDIGETSVLVDIAAASGLPADEADAYLRSGGGQMAIFEENARIHRLGINGVPTFIVDSDQIISGAQEEVVLVRLLDLASVGRPGNAAPTGVRSP